MLEIELTRLWVERFVIGLNLCPFAKAPQVKGQIRYVLCKGKTTESLIKVLTEQLLYLDNTPAKVCETTLIIHPNVLTDFFDYNDFLDDADALLDRLDLVGTLQIASFHPDYQFAGVAPDDISHATNRSPYPMLHLLREASIEKALAHSVPGVASDEADANTLADAIVARNLQTLQRLGQEGINRLWP